MLRNINLLKFTKKTIRLNLRKMNLHNFTKNQLALFLGTPLIYIHANIIVVIIT